jgi:hypothetical protein
VNESFSSGRKETFKWPGEVASTGRHFIFEVIYYAYRF